MTQETQSLYAMRRTLGRRGPDDEGAWVTARAGIVHRRLVVVDPAGGGQPMVRERCGRTYVITYNGELYNTDEVRSVLQAKGWDFRSHSDTEVLITSYMEWGPQCVERLNGIFAFGIWEDQSKTLFLARDRLGVKPLFYAHRGSAFIFASEPKALLACPLVSPDVDAEGLAEIFCMGPSRTPGHGVFKGVHELLPGCSLVHTRLGTRVERYWKLESREHEDDFEKTLKTVRELFEDTVSRQLVSDVPVCTLLSGGLDSSAVSAIAAATYRARGERLVTYSVDYAGNDLHFRPDAFEPDPDAPWARRVSTLLQSEHRVITVDNGDLADALRDVVTARDMPGMADIDSSLLLFCKEIKKGATVALSGECADELFAGYPWFRRREDLDAGTFPWMRRLETRTKLFSPALSSLISAEQYVARRYREALAETPDLPGEEPTAARMRQVSYLTLTRFMPTLLDRKDRMSMACGLEVRVPYCDHRLVEYVWNVPWSMKNHEGREKGILRRSLRGLLPEDVLWRKKTPYPKTHDPMYTEVVGRTVLDMLDDPSSPLLPFINRDEVRGLVEDERRSASFDVPWFGQLMKGPQMLAYLIEVDFWLREYKVRIV
jgi:asparagine synthase (glutamine-hydrolysing)